jgi:hypothetical protein
MHNTQRAWQPSRNIIRNGQVHDRVARPLASDVSTRRRPCHSLDHWPREQGMDVVTIGQPCRLNVKHCAQCRHAV